MNVLTNPSKFHYTHFRKIHIVTTSFGSQTNSKPGLRTSIKPSILFVQRYIDQKWLLGVKKSEYRWSGGSHCSVNTSINFLTTNIFLL